MIRMSPYAVPGLVAAAAFVWLAIEALVTDPKGRTARGLAVLMSLLAAYSIVEVLGHDAGSSDAARFWLPIGDLLIRLIGTLFLEFLVRVVAAGASGKRPLRVTRALLWCATGVVALAVLLRVIGLVPDAWVSPALRYAGGLYWEGPGPLASTLPAYLVVGSYALASLWFWGRRHGSRSGGPLLAGMPAGALVMAVVAAAAWAVQIFGTGLVAGIPFLLVFNSMLVLMAIGVSAGLRRQTLAELRVQRDTRDMILQAMGDGLLLFDRTGRIELANRRIAEMTGYNPGELVGEYVVNLFHPEEKDLVAAQIAEPCLCDIGTRQRRLMHKSGTEVPVLVSCTPRLDQNGRCERFVLAVTDIREMVATTQELRRKSAEISALHSVAATAGQSLNVEEVLVSTLEVMVRILDMETGTAYVLDQDRDRLRSVGSEPASVDADRAAPVELEAKDTRALTEKLGATLEPIFCEDVAAESSSLGGICALAQGAFVAIPLAAKGRVLGAICVGTREPRKFSRENRELIAAIGAEVGVFLENAALFEEAGKRGVELLLLHEVGRLLARSPVAQDLWEAVARKCADGLDADACMISASAEDATRGSWHVYCRHEAEGRRADGLLRSGSLDVELGPAGHSLLAGRAFVSNRGEGIEQLRPELADFLAGKRWLAVPIRSDREVVGAIVLVSASTSRWFSSRDVFVVQEIAGQLARTVERMKLFAGIEESERRYRSLVENASDGVFLCDRDGKLIFASSRMAEISGRKLDKLLDTPVGDIFDEVSRVQMTRAIEEVASSRRTLIVVDGTIEKRRGRQTAVQVGFTGLDYADGTVAVQGIVRDRSQDLEAEKMKSDLVSMVSHELRSPLTLIAGYTTMLQKPQVVADSKKHKHALQAIEVQVQRMLDLVEELLLASRIEHGSIAVRKRPIDLSAMAARFARAYGASSEKHNVRCKFADGFPLMSVDESGMEQVFANLISNAVKYSPDGGDVVIEGVVLDEGVEISVSDHGVGIDPSEHEKIFARFYQADMTSTRRYEGIGLGLFLTRAIVEAHGGSIGVDSKSGHGSKFTVRLPLDGARAEASKRKQRRRAKAGETP